MDDINCVVTIVDPQFKAALFQNETVRMHAINLLKKEIIHNDGIQYHQVEEAHSESVWDALDKLPLSIQGNEPDPKIKAIDAY
ncbi:hypothetical protein PR048_032008 [Dryococelus australis]|uniref:Uncharacterized protein n=1 Tax=Dryococelus australis TaxID=614101 RepID=A0ABQ9GAV7_9NEOP|nr:hypothetical protein PR048_032008 [Dryococelus australis]